MKYQNIDQLNHREFILVKNASQNNLKGIDLAIPQNQFIVVTGVSGSGKSSLAFDTLYAEGQRRYIESLSAYIRQFLGKINKPEVDYIKGLAPAIAIQQKVSTANPRSTVGTFSEVYDYLKLLYARIGHTISPKSGQEVKRHTVEDVLSFVRRQSEGARFQVIAPIAKLEERSWEDECAVILQKGFTRMMIGHQTVKTEEMIEQLKGNQEVPDELKPYLKDRKKLDSETYLVIDRLSVKAGDEDNEARIADSAQTAFFEGHGTCILEFYDEDKNPVRQEFNNKFELDGMTFEEPTVNLFTYNSPHGACPTCEGFGQTIDIDEDKVVPDKSLSVYENAIACWRGEKMSQWKKEFIRHASDYDFPIHRPYNELTADQKSLLWEGKAKVPGIYDFFDFLEKKSYKIQYRILMARYKGKTTCRTCHGKRLREEATYVKINGRAITDLIDLPIEEFVQFFQNLELPEHEQGIAKRLITEINIRTQLLCDVGLNYLSLNRPANTLSGGETQRIQLVTSLGSNLTGSLYILDEPSVGLHPRDNDRLVKVLKNLKSLGNTVVVVEHDEEIIRAADQVIDIGPHAGSHGGKLVFQGTVEALEAEGDTLTADYMNGRKFIPVPQPRRKGENQIQIEGAFKHNLKQIDVNLPLQAMTVITGVSGSGKSTLARDVIEPSLKSGNGGVKPEPHNCHQITLPNDAISRIEYVDQNPLGKSSRSNPVTYLKAYDPVRELFAKQPMAKMKGFKPAHFSFNMDGGRCDNCKGEGYVTVEMQFMADLHLICEECNGKRFKNELLEVTYNDRNINDVLEMTVDEAIDFFKDHPEITRQIQPLADVGLGYVKLGQPSINLSGGEAQRIKLASFLTKSKNDEPVLFIFDEPTTGLHFHDIHNLLTAFNALIDNGHTVMIVEHNMEIVKSADWLIDLGPEGGDKGGHLVYQGAPEGLVDVENSHTGAYLNSKLKKVSE